MTETTETEPRFAELSASALVLLEPPSRELARYEDCSAEPTVRKLPDFSVVDDAPTLPRALPPLPRVPMPARSKPRRALPPIAPLPPKPPEPAPAAAEEERTSVIPVELDVKRPFGFRFALPALAGALLGLALFSSAYFALRPARPAAPATRGDALLVTVAGPGGGAVDSPQVFIDGVRRCESSPCLVPGLSEGLHFVTVTAPAHVTTSPRVVRVAEREGSLLHVELARESAAAAAAPAPPTPAAAPDPLPPAMPEPAVPPKRAAPFAPVGAFLNLNSVPASAVVLDGQPLGRTPKLDVPVKPGSHVVVFVHPESGRQTRAVMVEAGARQTVAVRF